MLFSGFYAAMATKGSSASWRDLQSTEGNKQAAAIQAAIVADKRAMRSLKEVLANPHVVKAFEATASLAAGSETGVTTTHGSRVCQNLKRLTSPGLLCTDSQLERWDHGRKTAPGAKFPPTPPHRPTGTPPPRMHLYQTPCYSL